MGLRIRLSLLALTLATPVAAGVLPFEGAYGNDAGCDFYVYGAQPAGDYFLLTPDTFASPHLSCDFGSLVAASNGHDTVAAVCSPGGKTTVEITEERDTGFAVSANGLDFGPAPPCRSIPANPEGTIPL